MALHSLRGLYRPLMLGVMAAVATPRHGAANAVRTEAAARVRVPAAVVDTADVHRELRKSIERFQDAWRKAWQKVEIKRHKPLNLSNIRGWNVRFDGLIESPTWEGDRAAGNLTTELRRYLSILCYVDTPTDRQIEAVKARTAQKIGTPFGRVKVDDAVTEATQRGVRNAAERGTDIIGRVSFATPRQIQATPNYGAVCPGWIPPDERLPLDEGEAIDLALPPANREAVRRERDNLIRVLEAAHAQYPLDDWIAGQRVRFVLDQRSPARGVAAASACQGAAIWCTTLMGLAQEHAGNVASADSTYRRADSLSAAAQLDEHAACIDPEVLLLLAPGDRDDVEHASCPAQRQFVETLWWLADPLWSIAGNERYVAHASRRVHAQLRAALDRDERYIWALRGGGRAMRELVIRYGWPGYTFWPGGQLEEELNKLRESRTQFVFPPYTAKEYSADRTALVPAMAAIRDPYSATPSHWNLHYPEGTSPDEWWPQEHMMLWTQLAPLAPGQQAAWRRDSVILFAMAVDHALAGLDTAARGLSDAVLAGGTTRGNTRELARTRIGLGETLRLRAEFASSPLVLSAEVQARTQREPARRLRYGLHPPPTLRDMKAADVALSDPVFMRLPRRAAPAPTALDTVMQLMAGDLAFSRTEPLAVYWESYGFAPGDTVQFNLRIVRHDDVGLARRLGSSLGLVSPLRDSISISWTEPDARHGTVTLAGARPVVGRSVALDMASLPPGSYLLSIEMRRGSAAPVRSERPFVLETP